MRGALFVFFFRRFFFFMEFTLLECFCLYLDAGEPFEYLVIEEMLEQIGTLRIPCRLLTCSCGV
jgi:hypothetical protein